jgi:uncharacterized protein (TIGR02145 family)
MSKFNFSLVLILFVNLLSLTATNSIRLQFFHNAPIDSVKVENLDNQTAHTFTGGSELLFFFGAPTSVEKLIISNDELQVFSSPNQREVNILFNQKIPGVTACEIFDVQGRLVSSVNGNLKEESQSFTFIPDSKGAYLVRVTSGNTTRTAKFISYCTASVPILFKNGTAEKAAFKAPLLSYAIGRLVINQKDLLRIQCFSGTKSQTMYEYATSDKSYNLTFTNRHNQFRLYNIVASKPSFVDVMFSVTDASHRGVDDLNNVDFPVQEDGVNISASESFRHVQRMNQVPFQIVLLIDNSISIVNDLQNIKESALQFVKKIRPFQQFAVYVFSDTPVMLQDFTNDTTKLRQAVEKIELGYHSTNLYGSVINTLSKWTDEFSPDNFKQGALVLFTDGNDTQGSSTLNQVIAARGQKKVYVVGMGNEVTPSILSQISYPNEYIPVQHSSQLENAFLQIQADIVRFSNSFYWLKYMSPKRSGTHTLSISTFGNTNTSETGMITGSFSANGFQSVNKGVYVNISDDNLYGFDSIFCFYNAGRYEYTFSRFGATAGRDSLLLKPITFWASKLPVYSWTIQNNQYLKLEGATYSNMLLNAVAEDTISTTLTLIDEANNYNKQLVVQIHPHNPIVNISAVDKITTTAATCYGEIRDEGRLPVLSKGFVWSTSEYPPVSLSTKTTEGAGTGSFASSITGLSASTTYFVRAYATNSAETSYSNQISFTTKSISSPVLTTVSVSNITTYTASSGGSITSSGGADITARGVVWGNSQNPTVSLSTKTSNGTGTGSFTSSITGLSASTTYYVRAYATNSAGTAYGNQVSFTTTAASTVSTVTSHTGKVWLDRNLGASRVATYSADAQAYGDLFQWGRDSDGHEKRTSQTTTTLSSSNTPGHGKFIIVDRVSTNHDWRSSQNNNLWQGVNGINNPCPEGFRIPTAAEWDAECASWFVKNKSGAIASPLKLPVAGERFFSNGSIYYAGSNGLYWSSTVAASVSACRLYFDSEVANTYCGSRSYGFSVRCIKD